ncbi:nuclear transport factor 2 family protein [Sphingomonas soli]|uniref:nuclear transport factor 2 family protein n=1 Tax=Sphingomonas soli TaxID=266127 RepID=UPI00082D5AF3|nr:nuclear transport factor 2 family protein [Sphingomonas soli]
MSLSAALALFLGQATPTLREEISAADAALFEIFFERCDPVRLASLVTPDFEMYHDRDGVVATNGAAFVAMYAKQCEAKKASDAWRSRRALLPETLRVEPVPGYGAIEEGEHLFYERKGDGPEKLVGKARFVQLWKKSPDDWRVARILSYAHQAL